MSRESDPREKSLEESLSRVHEALARTGQVAPAKGAAPARPPEGSLGPALGSGALATVFLVLAVATGHWWLVLPALLFGAAAGILALRRFVPELAALEAGLPHREGGAERARVGMGATIASDAVLEPGAVIEMGATVGSGATIRSGAVVRMGATVQDHAVIEERAVVSWGATVHSGAVVGSDSVIGAGSDVRAGARVPPNTSLMPGSSYLASSAPSPAPAVAPTRPRAEPTGDPREERIDTICDRLEAELSQAPENVRAFLGAGTGTITMLRRTCHDLLRRERALRGESSREALSRLDSEKAVLESRIAETRDELVRHSLQGAVTAIDEQKRQRELLQRNADRLDAEFTRLAWTLEGMIAQVVRLRTVSTQTGAAMDPELERSLHQLHDEIGAIADALEHVSSGLDEPMAEARMAPIDESVSGPADGESARSDRSRQRE